MIITSKENETIKHIKKLKEKKYRDEFNEYIVEGLRLVNEAIKEEVHIKNIIVCEDYLKDNDIYECNIEKTYVNKIVFDSITEVKNPQGILAIIGKDGTDLNINYNEDVIVVLDNIQDPGNIGTILRTVDSVGLTQIIVSKGSADAYNSKVIRSTMGAIFRVKIIESENLVELLKNMQNKGYKVVSSILETDKTIYDIDYKKSIVVVGNEGNGISKDIIEISNEKVKIPMIGKTESLNASVATGIILYEYVRQNR
ncbi:MAG: RNA methyltransferase [Clostridia bacterium]|nr:RNA methyltransferase [Clostridia bacterium]